MPHYKPYSRKRAQKRLEGEDVFGNKIRVANPTSRESPFKNYTGRKTRSQDALYQVPPIPVMYLQPGVGNFYSGDLTVGNPWRDADQGTPTNAQSVFQSMFRPIRGTVFKDASYTRQSSTEGANSTTPLRTNRSFGDADVKAKPNSSPVELIVSNLDSSISQKEMQNVLLTMIKQYAMILSLNLSVQADGSPYATVIVGSQQEAQFVISQLHHQWLGNKRVVISYAQNNSDPNQLRWMVISVLREVPGNRMPLFKFFELVESRYHCNISLSEVNKLRDVCRIMDGHNGRTISLTSDASISSLFSLNNSLSLYCTVHCPNGLENRGWGEAEEVVLPNVKISLKSFSERVKQLIVTHMGCLPLLSFPICYASEFNQPLPMDDSSVPLEHLLTCISNIELSCSEQNRNVKFLKLKEVNEGEEDVLAKSVSPSLMTNVTMLCREVVDLLKTTDRCQLLMSRYIPAYHHHFGRQCRVADYGFTRLIELFEAIPHVVQIIGSGPKRAITLTHSAQVRRFTSDLLRVVKSQVSTQISLTEFPAAFEKVLNKPFSPVEYGLCFLEDLLDEVPENTVVIARANANVVISIPKKEQTPEQMQRTKQFAVEVMELLSHSGSCSILFNKFVPAYHHHFGRQCKVSEYGFAKLAELFEAIPDTVEMEGSSDVDRRVKLRSHLALKVLGSQIQNLVKELRPSVLVVDVLSAAYKRSYGITLRPEAYDCKDFHELITRLGDFVQVVQGSAGPMLVLTDVDNRILEIRIWSLLLNPPHITSIKSFIYDYRVKFQSTIAITKLESLTKVIVLSSTGNETMVSLTDHFILAAQLYHLLFINGGHLTLNNLEATYLQKFGRGLKAAGQNFSLSEELLRSMKFLVVVRGKKRNVYLNKELADFGVQLPPSVASEQQKQKKELSWPAAPAQSYIANRITPPKPDTPPAENGWNSIFWNDSPNIETLNLSIPLPSVVDVSKILMESKSLLSPTRGLLSAAHPLNVIPKITAPHPAILPLPDKLIIKDESIDSGLNNTKMEYTLSDSEFFPEAPLAIGCIPQPGTYKTFSTLNM